jgi:hypothetical protein
LLIQFFTLSQPTTKAVFITLVSLNAAVALFQHLGSNDKIFTADFAAHEVALDPND